MYMDVYGCIWRQLEARGIWARVLELDIGTTKNEFRACDLPPGGREKTVIDY